MLSQLKDNSNSNFKLFDILPPNCFLKILRKLHVSDLVKFGSVNKKIREIIFNPENNQFYESLWRSTLMKDYHSLHYCPHVYFGLKAKVRKKLVAIESIAELPDHVVPKSIYHIAIIGTSTDINHIFKNTLLSTFTPKNVEKKAQENDAADIQEKDNLQKYIKITYDSKEWFYGLDVIASNSGLVYTYDYNACFLIYDFSKHNKESFDSEFYHKIRRQLTKKQFPATEDCYNILVITGVDKLKNGNYEELINISKNAIDIFRICRIHDVIIANGENIESLKSVLLSHLEQREHQTMRYQRTMANK